MYDTDALHDKDDGERHTQQSRGDRRQAQRPLRRPPHSRLRTQGSVVSRTIAQDEGLPPSLSRARQVLNGVDDPSS
ncbi:hypothetical protein GCM10023196_091190 [Actinoallomurus vinaceus]|uniref:Uncharacterized protein n=1 Tax=Actinoallomurus vinaceus TaxID=1080074 RepID=A0ABP8UR93_9ACTN